jgi:hypothetical protein
MEPIIEILAKNIYSNNTYNKKLKNEFITTINRISNVEIHVRQLYRTLNYLLLYNYLYEEIIYTYRQQEYFNAHLNIEIKHIFNDYLNERINIYNNYMNLL